MTRALIVDDKPENLYLLRTVLQGHGHEVIEARHGAEALAKARADPPQIVISDLLMPVMDGYTLLRQWKADARLQAIPFVVYTATYTDPRDERLALDLGADAFILKPAEPAAFMLRIGEVLARERSGELPAPHAPLVEEETQLAQYSRTLVRKLEEKTFQLEHTNRELREDIARRERAEAEVARLLAESERARAALLGILEDERAAKAALRTSERRFRLAAATGDVWDADVGAGRGYVPAHFKQVLGYEDHEIENTVEAFAALVHPDDRTLWQDTLRNHFVRHLPYEFEFRARCKSGEYRWFATRGQAAWDESGRATYMAGTVFDITERKRAEAGRLVALEHFEKIFLGAPEAMSISDLATGRFLQVNDAFCRMFGYARDALIGHTSLELDLWSSPSRRDLVVGKVRAGERVHAMEGHARTRSGEMRDTLFSADRVDFGGTPCLLLMFSDISERKRAENALQESEARFRQLAGVIDEVFWLTDPAKNAMLYISPAYAHVWGRSCESLYASPRDWIDAIHPDDRERVLGAALAKQADGTYDEEFRIVRPDGGVRWIRDRAFPVRDAAGVVQRVAGAAQDVTLRRQSEEALRDSESRLRLAIEAADLYPWDWDIAADRIRWSRDPARLLGPLGPEAAAYPDFRELVHSEDRERFLVAGRAALAGEAPYELEFRIRTTTGGERWLFARGVVERDAAGAPLRLRGVSLDISVRKRLEELERSAHERLRRLIDNLYSFVGLLTPQGIVREVNQPALRAAGVHPEAVLGKRVDETYWWSYSEESCARIRTAIARAAAGEPVRFDAIIRVAEDRRITIDFALMPVRGADGQVTELIASGVDITARKQAEAALRDANERLRALSARLLQVQEAERAALARELHDEIGQALTALKLGVQALARRVGTDAREAVARLVDIADRTLAQARNLSLDLRPPQLDHLGLAATLRDTLERVAGSANVDARLVAEPKDITLEPALATAGFRVAQEAITNAVRHAAARHLVVELRTTREAFQLAVSDDGRGFDLDAARSRSIRGGSIGLLGMEERVALAGGELKIVTRPGQGTRVQASFPLR